MNLPLVYRPEVRDEIDEEYTWYEEQRAGLGEEFLAAVRTTLDSIQRNPGRYGVVHREVRAAPMRRFPYVAYYRVEADRIVVMAIQHGRRDPRRWRSRV